MEEAQALEGICVACTPGMFAAADGDRCQQCPAGTWGSGNGLSKCTACPQYHSSDPGATDQTQCKALCGLLTSIEITQLCVDRGANGLVAEASSTAYCSGSACDGSGPSSPDAERCCLPDAACSSEAGTGLCKNAGANGLIDEANTTLCKGNPCTVETDATTCCKPDALCSTMNVFRMQQVCGVSGRLIDDANTTFCEGLTCNLADAEQCCISEASCASISDSAVFCKDHGGNGLIDAAETIMCKESSCTAKNDAVKCCKPSAVCTSMSQQKIKSICGTSNGLKSFAAGIKCDGIVCSMADKTRCCQSSSGGESDGGGSSGGGSSGDSSASDNSTKIDGNGTTTTDQICPVATCKCSNGEVATGAECIYNNAETCLSCDEGYYRNIQLPGVGSCQPCEKGSFQPQNFSTATSCTKWKPCTVVEAQEQKKEEDAQKEENNSGSSESGTGDGRRGLQGPRGFDGPRGFRGLKGEGGGIGPIGFNGTSVTGEKGEKGEKGDDGIDGSIGPRGFKGINGTSVTGERGERGQKGDHGLDGINGGEKGRVGDQGTFVVCCFAIFFHVVDINFFCGSFFSLKYN